MEKKTSTSKGRKTTAAFRTGVIAVCFLLIGYETALFVFRAARLSIAETMDSPDTVYIIKTPVDMHQDDLQAWPESETSGGIPMQGAHYDTVRKEIVHPKVVKREMESMRVAETFRFNPNTVSQIDLQRLGFSEKQAAAIVNYRNKGGKFRRKSDFAKSFVVADSVYERLEAYINIPLVDINKADSAALDELPGIGPYFASAIVAYREKLGGYSYTEQLMDIRNFSSEKYDALKDLVCCTAPEPFGLWTLGEDELRKHPYINSRETAHSIVLYRKNNKASDCSVEKLKAAGILSEPAASKLCRCVIAEPSSQ